MARKSAGLAGLSALEKEELAVDIMRGDMSWRAIGGKYGVPEATVRNFAARHNIQRNPTGAKRERVAAKLAEPDCALAAQIAQNEQNWVAHPPKPPPKPIEPSPEVVKASMDAAVDEDVRDMRYGLNAARMALNIVGKKLQLGLQNPDKYTPRDIKCLSESVALNIGTIRAIRGLDAPPPDLARLSDEQLEALSKGKKID